MGIKMGSYWMRLLAAWNSGEKHPDTPQVIFYNVWGQDRARRVLSGRCRICGYVISSDDQKVKELAFICDDKNCDCHKMYGPISHKVCDACFHMHRALYANYLLKNMNYFRDIDDKIKRDGSGFRDRAGL